MKKIVLGLFLFSMIFVLSLVQAESKGKKEEVEKEFNKADVINDGKIDQGEFDIYHYNVFKLLDGNHDHVITIDECVSNCFTEKSKVQKMDNIKYNFNNIDIDGNGIIQTYEYIIHGREEFDNHDINGDDFIDKNEFCTFYQAAMPCSFVIAEEGDLK